MSNQIQITSGAKVRNLEGVLTGSSGIMSSLPINTSLGIPQLDVNGKILVDQLPNSIMEYKGSWNAATNTPTLVNGTGNAGDVYLCEVAGTVNFGAGPITFAVGDQVIYSGAIWQRASGATGTVTSVAVTESGDALTITGSPITTSGTINIGFAGTSGQYVNGAGGLTTFPSLTGFVPYTGATANVDLGTNNIFASFVYAEGAGGSSNGGILIKQYSGALAANSGYTSLFATPNQLGINFGGIYNTFLQSATLTASRTYTLPDLSGTLALLEGSQTFTGSKTFNSSIISEDGLKIKFGSASNLTAGYLTLSAYTEISPSKTILRIGTDASQLTLFRLQNTNSFTYEFPAASGTIALTSNLSAYVPYSGATNNVDLGSNHITSATIVFWKGTGSGLGNIGIGRIVPLGQNTTGQVNIGIGENSLFYNTTGSNNIALGGSANGSNTTGSSNIGIGSSTNYANTTSSNNIAIGLGALSNNTIDNNIAIGHLSSYFNTTGNQNVSLGYTALYTNTTGSINTAIGHSTLYSNTTGSQNTALGGGALFFNTTGSNNTGIGNLALQQNTTGVNNTAIGSFSHYSNTTGQNNTAIGSTSLAFNTTGYQNTAIGSASLNANTTAFNNTAIGNAALNLNTTGTNNTALGNNAGSAITTGSNNTIIGTYIGTAAMSNNIVLADGAGNIRYQFDGTNNIFTSNLNGTSASFASSGGSDTFAINHSSGSGIALNITKGGNGEGLVINKTSGSGNALSVTGSTSLGALSGTSATFSGNVGIGNNVADAINSASGLGNLVVGNGGGSSQGITIYTNSSTYGGLNFADATSGGGAYAGYIKFDHTNDSIGFFIGNTQRLGIASTGAATFTQSNGAQIRLLNYGGSSAKIQGSSGTLAIDGNNATTLEVNSSEVLRATSGGNVGIGTSSPGNKLTISNNGNAAVAFRINDTNANASFLSLNVSDSDAAIIAGGTSGIPFDIYTGGSIRMRIRNDGITMIGTTTYNSALKGILINPDGYAFYTVDNNTTSTANIYLNRLNADGKLLIFQKNTTDTGYISTNTYSLPSDLNFKKNISNLELGLNLVTKLRAVSYNHKIDDDDAALSTGFIAQELQQSLTELGVKENEYYILQHKPNEDESQSQYWLDYTKMIPILVKAIQELKAELDELKNK
jgi:hypothetical protein